ncbi:hypothetical protein HanXRQr2_Chr05g0231231 [Helianthus annuus]|uniref:Uncharacterized protein n=1 Tax=Helianthus annuus TaxID=4232 RepID=A0A251UTW4_HELAN|nr:hypothetical protein HanXRQr2_Chr05g0231231 [Helianthus annuus]KAJ0585740.1 hypothetical protein HanHA89_Chr05g0204151 [Helianthus annuus]KAJ0923987.1 hypothetical protein HanPSC8_Chr05g0223051 [Helianthus annuus]
MVLIPYTHGRYHTIFLIRHDAYISKRIQKLLEDVKVAPKMLLQTKRTTRVTINRTPCGHATQSGADRQLQY